MTSSVKITAHCASTKEVQITVTTDATGEVYKLQDGQSVEFYVYDDRTVTVREVVKEVGTIYVMPVEP